jgi:hypothetical protein
MTNETKQIGLLFNVIEDEDGLIEYEWNENNMIEIIKNMGYVDPEEIAKEIMTISSPDDELQMMRRIMNNQDLDITDLTIEMFKASVLNEFEY